MKSTPRFDCPYIAGAIPRSQVLSGITAHVTGIAMQRSFSCSALMREKNFECGT
jgi:hypothetical protein